MMNVVGLGWSPVVGLVAALFLSIGGAIATIAGDGLGETLGDPGDAGGFAGAVVQERSSRSPTGSG